MLTYTREPFQDFPPIMCNPVDMIPLCLITPLFGAYTQNCLLWGSAEMARMEAKLYSVGTLQNCIKITFAGHLAWPAAGEAIRCVPATSNYWVTAVQNAPYASRITTDNWSCGTNEVCRANKLLRFEKPRTFLLIIMLRRLSNYDR